MRRIFTVVGALAVLALLATACGGAEDADAAGGGGGDADSGGPVTLTWWHNATQDPLRGYFQEAADAYTAEHPDVQFKIEPVQNEQIQTKINVALQSNDPPDIFQQWGGGDLATQVESGKVADITEQTADVVEPIRGQAPRWQVDGKQYGLPFSVGVVGFWYRTDRFEEAGIDAVPSTMDELNAAVASLKDAGIAPIAVGSKDKWPDAFYWGWMATRLCSEDTLMQATADTSIDAPCFLRAGEQLQQFLDTEPFQEGFLGTNAQQGASSSAGLIANGKAAMELQGHWGGGVINGLTSDGEPLDDKLGWFPFPTIAGGEGAPDASFGGGDGFSCSTGAPPACADFLNFLLSEEQQTAFGETGAGLPVLPGTEDSVADPTVAGVLEARNNASFIQLYFDKALPTEVGTALNDQIANMFAGSATPEQIVQAVTDSAQRR